MHFFNQSLAIICCTSDGDALSSYPIQCNFGAKPGTVTVRRKYCEKASEGEKNGEENGEE